MEIRGNYAVHTCYDLHQCFFLHYLYKSICPFAADTDATKNGRHLPHH